HDGGAGHRRRADPAEPVEQRRSVRSPEDDARRRQPTKAGKRDGACGDTLDSAEWDETAKREPSRRAGERDDVATSREIGEVEEPCHRFEARVEEPGAKPA